MKCSNQDEGCTLVIRLIRSFEHRNIRNVIYHNIDTSHLVSHFISFVLEDIKKRTGLPLPVRTYTYDTMKIQHKAFGAKTSDPVINIHNDEELILCMDKSLLECGVINETEISFFSNADYRLYQKNPQLVW